MQQKRNTQSHFQVQSSIHLAQHNKYHHKAKLAYLICRKRTQMQTQAQLNLILKEAQEHIIWVHPHKTKVRNTFETC